MTKTLLPPDRTAVVTGAGSPRGIGRATAARLIRDGWSVALLDIDGAAARQAANDLTNAALSSAVQVLGIEVDISDSSSVDTAISRVEGNMPPVVALANIAGISSPTPFLEVTTEEWDRVLAVNLRGTMLTSQRLLQGMIDRHLGRIVNVSSVSAQRGGGTYSKVAYSASKAGIIGLTRALAREVGEHGVTVNVVSPGPVDTDIMGGTLTEERKAELSADLLVGRVGTVDEIAALLVFLMGEDAGYITAATYDINGGLQVS